MKTEEALLIDPQLVEKVLSGEYFSAKPIDDRNPFTKSPSVNFQLPTVKELALYILAFRIHKGVGDSMTPHFRARELRKWRSAKLTSSNWPAVMWKLEMDMIINGAYVKGNQYKPQNLRYELHKKILRFYSRFFEV